VSFSLPQPDPETRAMAVRPGAEAGGQWPGAGGSGRAPARSGTQGSSAGIAGWGPRVSTQ
jgi:hypothetical protein